MKSVGITIIFVLVAEILVALLVRSSGEVSVSALQPPSAFEDWLLGGASDRSIEAHAGAISAINHDDAALVHEGLEHYNDSCVVCHAAPGLDDSETAKGLNPPAPHLWTDDTQSMSDAQLFWVVKNGIRWSGMPAFGRTHDDQKVRAIVAFVRKLPSLKGGGYAAMVQAAGLKGPGGGDSD